MYHFCSETLLSKVRFSNPCPKNAQIVNLKKQDLDLIWRIHPECGFYGFMIRFWFPPQKTQNPFLDSEILICIFPTSLTGFLVTSRSVNVSVFDWLIRKQETFYSLIHGVWWGAGQAGESGGLLQSVVWVPFFFETIIFLRKLTLCFICLVLNMIIMLFFSVYVSSACKNLLALSPCFGVFIKGVNNFDSKRLVPSESRQWCKSQKK